jgi:hypothetical protein
MSMRIAGWLRERQIGGFLVLMLAAPTANATAMPWQDTAPARQDQNAHSIGAQEAGADGGNGKRIVDSSQSDAPLPDAPEVAQSTSAGSNESSGSSQPSQDQQQNGPAQPVGTAAAPAVKSTGVAGSRVSGAAIAPAKQRRVHTFLIRVAVVVAACVAVGTVVGLTHATPSAPRQ